MSDMDDELTLPEGFWNGWGKREFAAWIRKHYPRPKLVPCDGREVLYLIEADVNNSLPTFALGLTYQQAVNRFTPELQALVRCEVRPNEGALAKLHIFFYYGPSAVERWNTYQDDWTTRHGEKRWA
ncbi:MAG: hypothetical protein WCD63_04905 [Terrimicrobiaceae bacterium]